MNVDKGLPHIGAQGRAKMVDVTDKAPTLREAEAEAFISMAPETLRLIQSGGIKKGDVLAVAQVAGIMAAKRTHELIPMCHPLCLTGADIAFEVSEEPCGIRIRSTVRVKGETGVEMEALTARVGSGADGLRHGEGRRKGHDHPVCPADPKIRRKERRLQTDGSMKARVVSVNRSDVKGVPKKEVPVLHLIAGHGAEGDAHAGPWHRQVSLLAEESIDRMRELGLNGLSHGAFGENINTLGLNLCRLPIGTRITTGGAVLEITQIGKDCHNDGCAIRQATGMCVMPTDGVFAVVVESGDVRSGDEIEILKD
jgi:cyclic pyranopterin phosphate synthase